MTKTLSASNSLTRDPPEVGNEIYEEHLCDENTIKKTLGFTKGIARKQTPKFTF